MQHAARGSHRIYETMQALVRPSVYNLHARNTLSRRDSLRVRRTGLLLFSYKGFKHRLKAISTNENKCSTPTLVRSPLSNQVHQLPNLFLRKWLRTAEKNSQPF